MATNDKPKPTKPPEATRGTTRDHSQRQNGRVERIYESTRIQPVGSLPDAPPMPPPTKEKPK